MMKSKKIFLIVLLVLTTIVMVDNVAEAFIGVKVSSRNILIGDTVYFTAEVEREELDFVIIEWYINIVGIGTTTYPSSNKQISITVDDDIIGKTVSVNFKYYYKGFEQTFHYSESVTVTMDSNNDIEEVLEDFGCSNTRFTWQIVLLLLPWLFIFRRRVV